MRTLIKGEKRNVGIRVINTLGETFTIASAECVIRNPKNEVIETIPATIEDDKVFILFDTTLNNYITNNTYYVDFTISIENSEKVLKSNVRVYITI